MMKKFGCIYAEDDPNIRRLFQYSIEDFFGEDCVLHQVEDGDMAYVFAKSTIEHSIIVLDNKMPIKTGIECLTLLRDEGYTKPAFLYTSRLPPGYVLDDKTGLILKKTDMGDIVLGIHDVVNGIKLISQYR